MEIYSTLDILAEQYIEKYIAEHPQPDLNYHNIDHTTQVVEMVSTLSNYYKLDEKETHLIRIAAWFHDIGYYTEERNRHEEISAKIARNFLEENNLEPIDIRFIEQCILATQMPQNPTSLAEQILCDADLSHLASPLFYEKSKKLRKEFEKIKAQKISKQDWLLGTLSFIKSHQYFTSYGKSQLEIGKQKNIVLLEQMIKEGNLTDIKMEADTNKSKKEEKPSKGIETMFRITSSNNQKLSSMADNKAHILISVNSIILSAIISLLLRKLGEYEYLSIPTYIILTVSVISMIFSLIATRPNLPSGEFTKKDIEDKKVNLLFFGNFYKMSLEDYTKGMTAVMNDYQYLYQSLIKDVYAQGVVLSHKYKLLRISYTVFMFGMIISVIGFIVANIVHSTLH